MNQDQSIDNYQKMRDEFQKDEGANMMDKYYNTKYYTAYRDPPTHTCDSTHALGKIDLFD